MFLDLPIFSKNYFRFTIALILITAGILVWVNYARLDSFRTYHQELSHESVIAIEKQVAYFIAEKQRMVNIFAEEYIDYIRALASSPSSDDLRKNLGKIITRYFPDRFAFSIANNTGDMADIISDLLDDDSKKASMRKKALDFITENHSSRKNSHKIMHLLNELNSNK